MRVGQKVAYNSVTKEYVVIMYMSCSVVYVSNKVIHTDLKVQRRNYKIQRQVQR
jgi:cell division protein FtsL